MHTYINHWVEDRKGFSNSFPGTLEGGGNAQASIEGHGLIARKSHPAIGKDFDAGIRTNALFPSLSGLVNTGPSKTNGEKPL
ncbi:MAG: hypothetical protein ABSG32_25400 [Terriglobia bacterium]|jgi:hypothetical protein